MWLGAVVPALLPTAVPDGGSRAGAAVPPRFSYSILAHDPLTGEYGVASASHAPLVGMNLEWLDVAAGGVVVHGGPHLDLNERVLAALRDGLPAGKAIEIGLTADPDRERRQVLAIGPDGAAAYTGRKVEKEVSQAVGVEFVASGSHLSSTGVAQAMEAAFLETDGPLARRLLHALEAGRDAGGARGGAHSAALLVVGPGARFATRGRLVDLRVDFVTGDAVAALARLRTQVDSVYGIAP